MNSSIQTTRLNNIKSIDETDFDLVVLGGGIMAAALLLEAQNRGLKAIQIAQKDFSTYNDSGLIHTLHSGIYAFKNRQFKQLRVLAKERRSLYQNATHLVYNQKIIAPVYSSKTSRFLLNKLGFKLYDKLRKNNNPYYQSHYLKNLSEDVDGLKNDAKVCFVYYEQRFNTNRLVIETIKTAQSLGAYAYNYNHLVSIEHIKPNKAIKLSFRDEISKHEWSVNAKQIINTELANLSFFKEDVSSKIKEQCIEKELVIDRVLLDLTTPVCLPISRKRYLHLVPTSSQNISIMDIEYQPYSPQNRGEISNSETIQQTLDILNPYLKQELSRNDVKRYHQHQAYLFYPNNHKPLFLKHQNTATSVFGGIFVNHAYIARQTLDMLYNNNHSKNNLPNKSKLLASHFPQKEIEDFHIAEYAEQRFMEAFPFGADKETIYRLVYCYGTEVEKIIAKAFSLHRRIDSSLLWLKAELEYAFENEMLLKYEDFIQHRTEYYYLLASEELQKQVNQMF